MIPVISYAQGSFEKHLKSRQIPYQSVRGPLYTSTVYDNALLGTSGLNKTSHEALHLDF